MKFDFAILEYGFQFLDPELLKTQPFESIWYLHAQPPLFNIFLALVLNFVPENPEILFFIVFKFCGFVMLVGSWLLVRQLGGGPWAAGAVGIFLALSPGLIGYEHWLFYTLPVAMFLVLAACCLHRFLETGSVWSCALYFAIILALVMTRSMFHPVWFIVCGLIPFFARPSSRKMALAWGVPCLLCIFLLLFKNYTITGGFSTSSWLGMSLGKMLTATLSEQEMAGMIENMGQPPGATALQHGGEAKPQNDINGKRTGAYSPLDLPPIFEVETFESPENYFPYINEPEPTGIPALDQVTKSTGWPNMNHLAMVAASREYGEGARRLIIDRPELWLKSTNRAAQIYLLPSSEYYYLMSNVSRFYRAERRLNAVLYGKFGEHPFIKDHGLDWGGRRHGWDMIGFWIPLMLLSALLKGFSAARAIKKDRVKNRAYNFTVLFICFQIAWVTFFSIVLEVGENNRFRAQIEPLLVIVAAIFLCDVISFLSARRKIRNVPG